MTGRLVAFVFILIVTATAQIRTESSDVARRVRVRIAFADHSPCNSSTRVQLIGSTGFAVAEGALSGECSAEFYDVPAGRYRVALSGPDTTNADDGEVEVNSAVTQEVVVHAGHVQTAQSGNWSKSAGFVSVRDLTVPANAAKDFDRASRLIGKQEWGKATERLLKGLASYPAYAAGYNNLGAVYSQQGKNAEARAALQKAIELDERMAPAYVNLARLDFLDKNYPSAESLLNKSLSLAPAENADELFLLAYAQVEDKHFDDAIATCRKGHGMQFKQHAFLHLAAANASEQQGKIDDALLELQRYVEEAPNGVQVAKVRDAISKLQRQIALSHSSDAASSPN